MNSSKLKRVDRIKIQLFKIFSLDLRSLALLRISLVFVIMFDLIIRFFKIEAYYSDAGTLPRTELIDRLPAEYWSVHLFNGTVFAQQLLFCLALLCACLLLIGYRTTLASLGCWIMLVSLHNRNPTLVSSGDDLLRIVLFWSMFLPLGAVYSGDRALNTSSKPIPSSVYSGATVGLVLLLGAIYLWQISTTETAVAFWSCLGWGLILIPWRNSWWRGVAITLSFVLLLSQGITTASAVLICVWLALLPSQFWQFLSRKSSNKAARGLTINYDKDCGFCKKVVYLLRTALILPQTKILEAQDNPDVCADMERYNSWVVEDYRGDRYFKWYGIAYVVSLSPVLWWLAPILRIKPLMLLGNKVYETIANNRRLMGNFTKPFVFRPLTISSSILLNTLSALFIALIVLGNWQALISHDSDRPNSILDNALQFTRLDLPENIF
ncbi:MAG: DCC1-like thiol-disulfide oxidoreductase family protein [Cyanobacteria bacterium J06631_2]